MYKSDRSQMKKLCLKMYLKLSQLWNWDNSTELNDYKEQVARK